MARKVAIILILVMVTVGVVAYRVDDSAGHTVNYASSLAGQTWIVISTADSGPGTLRSFLENATTGDTIIFDSSVFPPTSPVNIKLSSELPHIIQGNLTIDASGAGVILNGSGTLADTVGLVVDSENNTIKGLQVLNFPGWGIMLTANANYNTIGGDRTIGTAPSGEGNIISANGRASAGGGITLSSSSNNTISGNNITNNGDGIWLSESSNNKFYHNTFIDNVQHVHIKTSGYANFWDSEGEVNYWGDYEERYPNAMERDGTGIWDTPYEIDADNIDHYPIVPEFPSFLILPLFMVATLLAVIAYRRKHTM